MTDSRAVRQAALLAGGLAGPLVVLTVLVVTTNRSLMSFDARVVRSWEGAVAGTGWHHAFLDIAAVFQPVNVIAMMALLAAAFWIRRRSQVATWIILVAATSRVANLLMKHYVHRERPDVPHQISGYSFPSGHSDAIAAAMAVLVVLTLHGVDRPLLRRGLTALWVVVAVVVGLDRIFLGAHYPSDVVAGWLLGALLAFASAPLFGLGSTARFDPVFEPVLSVPMEDRRLLAVVLNPVKIDNAEAFKARVGIAARAAGWDEPLWFETTIDDAGGSMARAAIAAGADVVAVAGGDGTIRVVCSEMAGTGVAVGIIPAGTGNLLARNLNIPLPRDLAIDTVLRGEDRAIDVVRVSGDSLEATRFVVMAGLGLDAAIMAGAPDALKARIGWPAYVVSGSRYLRYPAVRVDIIMDGGPPVRRRVRTVLIGNVGFLQAGIPLLPDALIDDGVLDVVVIAPQGLFRWVPLALRVLTRRRGTDDELDRFTGRSVVLRAAHATPRQLDGDPVGAGTELSAEIEPGVLLVRVPPRT
jgi:diacylglycerol kinase family enzyme/membrane-associated phospholipid phosphatase